MTTRATVRLLAALLLMPPACSEVCDPDDSQQCACSTGEAGHQHCASDGSGWGECECGVPDADSDTDADTDADTDGDTDVDTDVDTDTDTGPNCIDSCAAGFHDDCTCHSADPCGWAENGVCDGQCLEWQMVDEMFDDSADCSGPCSGTCGPIGDFVKVYTECACELDDICGWAEDGICDAPCWGGEYPPNTDGPWSGVALDWPFDDYVDCAECLPDDVTACDETYAACQIACGDDGGAECFDACFADYCDCVTGIGCDPADYDCT